MSPIKFTVPKEFPAVLLCCVVLCCLVWVISFYSVKVRRRIFTPEFLAMNFEKDHSTLNQKSKVPALGGLPDAGDGRYSKKLEYKEWVEFNNAQRVHMNTVEQLPTFLFYLTASALILPIPALVVAVLSVFFRTLYMILYLTCGANARMAGVLGNFIIYFLAIASTIKLCVDMGKCEQAKQSVDNLFSFMGFKL